MNVTGERAQVGVQIHIVNPRIYNTSIKNYINILQGTHDKFKDEIDSIREKWKAIQSSEIATDETTALVEKVTDNAEEVALKLKSMRQTLKHKGEYVDELHSEVVALRADGSDVLTVSKWTDCEDEYKRDEAKIEERRIEKLKQEKRELDIGLSIIKARYKTALSELCEADEKLQQYKMLFENLEDSESDEMETWQEKLKLKDSGKKKSGEDLLILKKNVEEMRKKIESMEKRSRCEKEEYRRIQQQCLDAVDRMKELRNEVLNKELTSSGITGNKSLVSIFSQTDNTEPLKLEEISTSVDSNNLI